MKRLLTIIVALIAAAYTASAQPYTAAQEQTRLVNLSMNDQWATEITNYIGGSGQGYLGAILANNTYLKSRNAANTANLNLLKADATDDTQISSDAGDFIYMQIAGDAQRLFTWNASSDTAFTQKFGDAGVTASQVMVLSGSTADADDDSILELTGGGAYANDGSRGAALYLGGDQANNDVVLNAGATSGGDVILSAPASNGTIVGQIAGATEISIANDQLSVTGATFTVLPGATAFRFVNAANNAVNLSIADAGALTARSTFTSSATSDIGWSVVAGANTACNTTCTFACVSGFDSGSSNIPVACSSALADVCLCAGAS